MSHWPLIVSMLVGLEAVIRVVLVVVVVMRRRPVPVTLAWMVVLFFLPVVSTIAYLMVGEIRLGSRASKRFEAITQRIEAQSVALWNHRKTDRIAQDASGARLAKLGTAVSGLPPLRGNALELMEDSAEVLARLVSDIDQAQAHVHLLFYIWMPCGKADEVVSAVMRAANRGVTCRVLVDAVGSKAFMRSDHPRKMRAAGVKVVESLPVNPVRMLFHRIDLRNHRKIAVIDGRVAYSGSQNMTDVTFKVNRRKRIGPWIDATLRVRGPAVEALQAVFLQDWALDSGEKIEQIGEFMPDPAEEGGCAVHVIASGPGPQPAAIRQAIFALLFAAQEEIVMTTPYFIPDEAMKMALVNAVLRGAKVSIIVPEVLDAPITAAAGRAHFEDLLAAGVKILRHGPGLLHAKTFTIDRKLAVVGSANFDMRSFWLNFETTLIVYDQGFADEVRAMQGRYMASSTALEYEAWKKRGRGRRFVDNVAQLMGPLL